MQRVPITHTCYTETTGHYGPHQWRGMGGREDGNNRYFIIHFVCLLIAYSISRRKARKKMVAGAKKTQEERLRRENYEVKRKGGESHKKF